MNGLFQRMEAHVACGCATPHDLAPRCIDSNLGPAWKHITVCFPPSLPHFPFPLILAAPESHPHEVCKLCLSLCVQPLLHHFLLKYLRKVKEPL